MIQATEHGCFGSQIRVSWMGGGGGIVVWSKYNCYYYQQHIQNLEIKTSFHTLIFIN